MTNAKYKIQGKNIHLSYSFMDKLKYIKYIFLQIKQAINIYLHFIGLHNIKKNAWNVTNEWKRELKKRFETFNEWFVNLLLISA